MGERVFEKLADPQGLHKSPILVFAGDALAATTQGFRLVREVVAALVDDERLSRQVLQREPLRRDRQRC